jgi:hypothetical protein
MCISSHAPSRMRYTTVKFTGLWVHNIKLDSCHPPAAKNFDLEPSFQKMAGQLEGNTEEYTGWSDVTARGPVYKSDFLCCPLDIRTVWVNARTVLGGGGGFYDTLGSLQIHISKAICVILFIPNHHFCPLTFHRSHISAICDHKTLCRNAFLNAPETQGQIGSQCFLPVRCVWRLQTLESEAKWNRTSSWQKREPNTHRLLGRQSLMMKQYKTTKNKLLSCPLVCLSHFLPSFLPAASPANTNVIPEWPVSRLHYRNSKCRNCMSPPIPASTEGR